ncbi:hypothetical protein [Kutzneria kofuensis]|uniref:Uncharacterized protein n=1 Tax=Kutzneria kofuensis TaxID=103725 RepID=A0A7W9NK56_9PSEU|nr:hypothetical protein [Kutzneria kofuensis]MBB5895640.1 hypothetical protein [Kutzneria kofuensis]
MFRRASELGDRLLELSRFKYPADTTALEHGARLAGYLDDDESMLEVVHARHSFGATVACGLVLTERRFIFMPETRHLSEVRRLLPGSGGAFGLPLSDVTAVRTEGSAEETDWLEDLFTHQSSHAGLVISARGLDDLHFGSVVPVDGPTRLVDRLRQMGIRG